MKTNSTPIDDPAKYEVADVRPILKNMTLKEGGNLIHTDRSGLRLLARVEKGKIVGWVVTDIQGHPLPTTYQPKGGGKKGGKGGDPKPTTCWQCATNPKGETHCWRIPCPEGPFIPWE